MRFHLGAIPESPGFTPDASWRLIREPSLRVWQLIALPTGIVTAVAVAFLWFKVTPLVFELQAMRGLTSIIGRIACLAGVLVLHELIHFALHPMSGRSRDSVLVFWPSRMLLFAAYTGELTRNRCLIALLMPFFVISIIPLVVAAVVQVAAGWLAYVSIVNSFLACGDIVSTAFALLWIPADGVVRMQGWKTYLRRAEPGAAPNGGPAAPVDNSNATDRPPSVS
jgi:hypothetical protein